MNFLKQKLQKVTFDPVIFVLDCTSILGEGRTFVEVLSSQVEDNTISLDDVSVNVGAILDGSRTIAVGKAIEISLNNGISNREYRIKVSATTSDDEEMDFTCVAFVNERGVEYYGSAYYGAEYFALAPGPVAARWLTTSIDDRVKALVRATRAIDCLNYVGSVAGTQKLQFPRGTDLDIPDDLEAACYEEAGILLDGGDSQIEQSNLGVVSQGISSVRNTYDRTFVPANVRNGIMSYVAWSLLLPYLRDPNEVNLSRV